MGSVSVVLQAQRGSITFEHFTSDEGLSAPVTQITQDHFGFMWLGTTDGLNRFDGRNFVVYRNESGNPRSIPSNIINALCVDHKGHVWAATNGGVCYYDFEDDAFHAIAFPDSLEKIDKHRVHAVTCDPEGAIWFASRTHLHKIMDNQIVQTIALPEEELLQVKYLYADDRSNVWAGINDGLIRYHLPTKQLTRYEVTSPFTIEKN